MLLLVRWVMALREDPGVTSPAVAVFDAAAAESIGCAPQMASMRSVRGSLGAVTLGGRIYAIGGGEPGVSLETTEVYDPNITAWMPGVRRIDPVKRLILYWKRWGSAAV